MIIATGGALYFENGRLEKVMLPQIFGGNKTLVQKTSQGSKCTRCQRRTAIVYTLIDEVVYDDHTFTLVDCMSCGTFWHGEKR